MAPLTVEEALKDEVPAQGISIEEALGVGTVPSTWSQTAKEVGGKAASFGAATLDLLAGAPGAAAGVVANVGARVGTALAGGSPEEIRAAGAEWQQKIPEEWKAPFTNILQKLGGESWDTGALSAAMEKGIEGVSAVTKVPAGDLQLVFDTVMAAGGLEGLRAVGKRAATPRAAPTGAELITPEARARETAVEPAKPVDLGVVNRAWEAVNKEQALRTPEDIAAMKEAAMLVQPSKVWGSKAKGTGKVSEGYLVPAEPRGDIIPAEARRLMEKGGETLTPEEMTTVYRSGANEIKSMRGQAGEIDPDVLLTLGLASGTLAMGSAAYMFFKKWRDEEHIQAQVEDFAKGYEEATGQPPTAGQVRRYREDLQRYPKLRIPAEEKPSQPPWYRKPKEQWTLQDSLTTGGLLAATLPWGPASVRGLKERGSLVPSESRTSTIFEKLDPGKTNFTRTELEQTLTRPDVAKADKVIFTDILKNIQEEQISASTLVEEFQARKGPIKQLGQADTQTMATLAGLGLGGIAGSLWAEDPIQGAITGAIFGGAVTLPGARERIRKLAKGIDYTVGATSTRLLEKSPELFKLLNDYKWKNAVAIGDDLTRVVPWLKESTNLPKEQIEALQEGLFRKDKVAIDRVNAANPELAKGWQEVQAVLRERGAEASKLGRFKTLIEDYFPQRVKDYEGLMTYLGQETRTRLEQLIHDAEAKAARKHTVFTDTERDALINREIRNAYKTPSHLPAFAKARTISDVTKEMQQFYHTPQEALHITLREINNDIQLAKLFGRNLQQIKGADGKLYTDVETSVGNIVGEYLQKGEWSRAEQLELEGMIRALIGPGERGANPLLREAAALGYAATLGSIVSTAVQLGDPLKVVAMQGPIATLTAMARRLTGNTQITPEHFHLSDHIAQELAAGSGISLPMKKVQAGAVLGGGALGAVLGWRMGDDPWAVPVGAMAGAYIALAGVAGPSAALSKIMRHTGFSRLDMFGKGTSLEAAVLNAQKQVQTPKGTAELSRKYERMFGSDFPELVEDLKVKRMTDNVRSLAWIEASRDQPLSSLEMSEFQLAHPNARPAFMLKRWMLKQLDVYRRDVWNEIKKGDKESIARGLKNATAFSIVLGLSGMPGAMIADFLLGRELDYDWTDVPENVLKTFGFAEYTREKMAQGKVMQAVGNAFMPPFQIIDHVASGDPKAVRYIPILGKLYESHELGGKERMEIIKRNETRKKLEERFGRPLTKEEKAQMLPPLSPNAKLYLQQQREARSGAR